MATRPTIENKWGVLHPGACSEVWRLYNKGAVKRDEGRAGWRSRGVHRRCTH